MVKSTYQILKEIRDLIRAVILMLLAIMIFLILGCTKEPIEVDCDCGHIIRNTNDGVCWTVVIQNDCDGELDSTVWHFNMDDCRVGDVVCELKEIELDTCKTK